MLRRSWYSVIIGFSAVAMEACWVYALLSLMNNHITSWRMNLPLMIAVPFAAYFTSLLVRAYGKTSRRARYGLLAGVGVLLLLVTIRIQLYAAIPLLDLSWIPLMLKTFSVLPADFPLPLTVFITGGILWTLGCRLGNVSNSFKGILFEFQAGLLTLLLIFFISTQVETEITSMAPVAVIFMTVALVGLAIAYAATGNSWLVSRNRSYWLALLLVVVVVVIITGIIIASLATPDLIEMMMKPVRWVLAQVQILMTWLAERMPEYETITEIEEAEKAIEADRESYNLFRPPPWLKNAGSILINTLFVVGVLFALWRISTEFFKWLQRRLTALTGVEIEPLNNAFREDLLTLLRIILHKIRKLFGLLWFRRVGSGLARLDMVRATYYQFLNWAKVRGYPRLPFQTPYEYCYAMEDIIPDMKNELQLLTKHYVSARYGYSLPSMSEQEEIRQSWLRIKNIKINRRRIEKPPKGENQ